MTGGASDALVRGRDSESSAMHKRLPSSSFGAVKPKSPSSAGTRSPPSRGLIGRVTSGMKSLVLRSDSKPKPNVRDSSTTLPSVVNANKDSCRNSAASAASTATGSRSSRRSLTDRDSINRKRSEELNNAFQLPCTPPGLAGSRNALKRDDSLHRSLNPREPGVESSTRRPSEPSPRNSIRKRPFRLGAIYPIVADRLYFTVHKDDQMTHREARDNPDLIFFSADYQDRYEPFCADFGPVNVGVMHEFFHFMLDKMTQKRFAGKKMVYYIEEDSAVRTNAAFLLASFIMVYHKMTPKEAWAPFDAVQPSPWKPFRDATYCEQDYFLGILPCLEGVSKAMSCGWYNPKRFDLNDYHFHDHPQNADLHQVSDKFIAFRGPAQTSTMLAPGFWTFTPKDYLSIFKAKKVSRVIRLNEPSTYKKDVFEKGGFKHHDLYFDDCTVPSKAVIDEFMSIVEQDDGKVAIHCKAGLGRTGTLIAIYFMKHHGFTAEECIGWLRVCRPGSIIGPQQHWLHWAEEQIKNGRPLETDSRDAELLQVKSEQLAKQVADGMDRKAIHRAASSGDRDEAPEADTCASRGARLG